MCCYRALRLSLSISACWKKKKERRQPRPARGHLESHPGNVLSTHRPPLDGRGGKFLETTDVLCVNAFWSALGERVCSAETEQLQWKGLVGWSIKMDSIEVLLRGRIKVVPTLELLKTLEEVITTNGRRLIQNVSLADKCVLFGRNSSFAACRGLELQKLRPSDSVPLWIVSTSSGHTFF